MKWILMSYLQWLWLQDLWQSCWITNWNKISQCLVPLYRKILQKDSHWAKHHRSAYVLSVFKSSLATLWAALYNSWKVTKNKTHQSLSRSRYRWVNKSSINTRHLGTHWLVHRLPLCTSLCFPSDGNRLEFFFFEVIFCSLGKKVQRNLPSKLEAILVPQGVQESTAVASLYSRYM